MDKTKSQLFREAMGNSKRELARKLISATEQLSTWTELSMSIAGYYYNIEPHADIFHGNTFAEETLKKIKEHALLALKDAPYSMVIYISDNGSLTKKFKIPVDVFDITDPEQWSHLIEVLNDEREHQLDIDRDDPPADCPGCMFGTSCNESTIKTGLRVYDCAQYAPKELTND